MTSSPSVAQPLGHHPCITEVSEAERGHARSVSQTRSPLKIERVHHGSFRRPRLALLSLGHSPLTKVTLHPRAWQLLASALDRSSTFPLCESLNSVGVVSSGCYCRVAGKGPCPRCHILFCSLGTPPWTVRPWALPESELRWSPPAMAPSG